MKVTDDKIRYVCAHAYGQGRVSADFVPKLTAALGTKRISRNDITDVHLAEKKPGFVLSAEVAGRGTLRLVQLHFSEGTTFTVLKDEIKPLAPHDPGANG
ncbi:MAG TPA: hypothetical protein VHD31_02660 [Candidatus Paceibacterota bacterium]|nr:hypothetical protein [Candidatus Paceibacterota bacterium]